MIILYLFIRVPCSVLCALCVVRCALCLMVLSVPESSINPLAFIVRTSKLKSLDNGVISHYNCQ